MYSVIILDDNKATARQIEQTVPWAELNCNVLCVLHDGASGKAAIEQLLPDLIITDIEMPKMDGHRLTKLVKDDKDLKHLPVIMQTAAAAALSGCSGLAAI